MRRYIGAFALLLALLVPHAGLHAAGIMPAHTRVAVMPVGAYGDAAHKGVDRMVSEIIVGFLMKESDFDIVDCTDPDIVSDHLGEQGLSLAGLTEQDAVQAMARGYDADYVVRGSILNLGASHSDNVAIITSHESHTMTAHIALRIVNVRTGAVVMAAKGEGSSSTTKTGIDTQILKMFSPNTAMGVVSTITKDRVAWGGGDDVSDEDKDRALRRAAADAVINLMNSIDGKNRKKG